MYRMLDQRLTRLFNTDARALLDGRLLGLEREALRVAPDGYISQVRHPAPLGSALTHPYITPRLLKVKVGFSLPWGGCLGRIEV